MKTRFELAQVIEQFEDQLPPGRLTAHHRRTLSAISRCRTAALGGHVDACDECGHVRISYNSCRNRHCPKCQGLNKEMCLPTEGRDHSAGRSTPAYDLFSSRPVGAGQVVVFTIPHSLPRFLSGSLIPCACINRL